MALWCFFGSEEQEKERGAEHRTREGTEPKSWQTTPQYHESSIHRPSHAGVWLAFAGFIKENLDMRWILGIIAFFVLGPFVYILAGCLFGVGLICGLCILANLGVSIVLALIVGVWEEREKERKNRELQRLCNEAMARRGEKTA